MKTESNCFFYEQYPKKVLYFVKVKTNGKLETRTKGIVDKCSDLTCTKKYALTEGPKKGGVNVGHSLRPPNHFVLATGLQVICTVVRCAVIGSLVCSERIFFPGGSSFLLLRKK